MNLRVSTVTAVLALLAPLLATTAAPASAAPPSRTSYDVLGDSYGSGYGVPPYTACGRSQSAYGVLVDGRARLDLDDFVACAGATTTSLVTVHDRKFDLGDPDPIVGVAVPVICPNS